MEKMFCHNSYSFLALVIMAAAASASFLNCGHKRHCTSPPSLGKVVQNSGFFLKGQKNGQERTVNTQK
jgi:hypothetical protein